MPADIYTVNRTKDLILSFIRARGPSLPIHIARDVKVSHLFASAFLSELYGEGKLKMSALKVGSSSLYYLEDQSTQLENFIEHLNIREKEAYALLKQEKILDDEKLEPVIRVALRALKDFAFPIKFTQNDKPRLFWRFFLISENEAQQRIAAFLEPAPKKEKEIVPLVTPAPEVPSKEHAPKPTLLQQARPKRVYSSKTAPRPVIALPLPSPIVEMPEKPQGPMFPFAKSVEEYLTKKDIKFVEIIEEKKKELYAKVIADTLFGKQHFFLIAKDKKRLKAEELILALQRAHASKMPALLLAPGNLEKKAQLALDEWGALIKFEKMQ